MDSLLNQRNRDIILAAPGNSVHIDAPVINIGANQENISQEHIEEAIIYCSRLRLENAPTEDQEQSQVYLSKLKRQLEENKVGTNSQHQMLRESTIQIRDQLDHIREYLILDEDGYARGSGSVDFGSGPLNHLYVLIRNDIRRMSNRIDQRLDQMDQRFERMDQRLDQIDQRFDRMDQRLDRMDQRLDRMDQRLDRMDQRLDRMDQGLDQMNSFATSERNRAKNKLLAAGGDTGTPNAYLPICNDSGLYPSNLTIESIVSLDQINRMNGELVDHYLEFYQLGSTRLVSERKIRLMNYIGIHEKIVVTQTTIRGSRPL